MGHFITALVFVTALCSGVLSRHKRTTYHQRIGQDGSYCFVFWSIFLLALAIRLNFYHKKAWVGLLLLALILAITTEYAQSLTPTRTMDKYDGLADILGATLALTFVSFITKQKTN